MDLHEVHGVDVSWLHHANKGRSDYLVHGINSPCADSQHRRTPSSTSKTDKRSTDDPSTPSKPGIKQQPSDSTRAPGITPPTLSGAKKDETPVVSSMSSPLPSPTTTGRERSSSASKRPVIGSRTSSGAVPEDGAKSKRPGWINNLSSKFSSQSTPTRNAQPSTPLKSPPLTGGPQLGSSPVIAEVIEQSEPYVPSKPKESGSFFSSLSRRLSSGSQTGGNGRTTTAGVLAPRRVLNIDPNRERCLVPELDSSKLRKVSFCVDVEIAGGPKYTDDLETDADKQRKKAQAKLKERAEGEALKHPDAIKDDTTSQTDGNRSRSTSLTAPSSGGDEKDDDTAPRDSLDENASRKREKKKRSEAERKERKEQRLRRAQESGQIPVEFGGDDEEEDAAGTAPASKTPKQLRPTTDPARIYRRCCQLRETPILKRITEQLMNPKSSLPNEPGVVACLDLTGSRMQLPDVVTLGDWLAVVPVKRLLLEDADLNDEGVRCVLAGLLSAKKPELSRKKRTEPHHREGPAGSSQYRERSGIVEKVTFKNNPRISRNGWKHISLFIYMCRSIKAIDLSMNKFPDLPPSLPDKPAPSRDAEPAEIFFKCLSERLGGNRLEELSVSECQLKPTHLRKIIDGAMMCGVSRLGLAGNNLSDEGLEHVLHYLRSGVCHGIDLGGNNLKGKLELIADSLIVKPDNPCWGLSLSDCDLDADSVRPLFPALVKLLNFRFIDLGNNKKLCKSKDVRCHIITLLRRYLPQMKQLKRIHLNNVGMSPKQAIALAEILAECPRLAHVSILENPQISTLANGTDEETQEEACALYASLMVAVRCSKTLICLDVDVPSQDNSEVVKALAKQVVAYCLRNMEDFAIEELTGENAAANAAAQLAAPHGGEHGVKKMTYPDVLMHLVGHVDDVQENHDSDDPAPDDDYIVGGTGVVKALQYVLGEKANDLRRTSVPGSPASGPLHSRPGSSAGLDQLGKTKAHQMSRSLLDTARKIRKRLHPAIVKESTAGDEMAFRRLQFLDHTLQSMIARFEEEFPETKVEGTSTTAGVFLEVDRRDVDPPSFENEAPPELDLAAEEDEDDLEMHPGFHRRNSDASLYSRSMTLEEGRLHRLGQALRRDVIASSQSPIILPGQPEDKQDEKLTIEKERIRVLAEKIESTPGEVLKPLVDKHGWQAVLKQLGANYEDLRAMSEQDPEGWAQFTDAQLKAKLNLDRHRSVDESMPELSAV